MKCRIKGCVNEATFTSDYCHSSCEVVALKAKLAEALRFADALVDDIELKAKLTKAEARETMPTESRLAEAKLEQLERSVCANKEMKHYYRYEALKARAERDELQAKLAEAQEHSFRAGWASGVRDIHFSNRTCEQSYQKWMEEQ